MLGKGAHVEGSGRVWVEAILVLEEGRLSVQGRLLDEGLLAEQNLGLHNALGSEKRSGRKLGELGTEAIGGLLGELVHGESLLLLGEQSLLSELGKLVGRKTKWASDLGQHEGLLLSLGDGLSELEGGNACLLGLEAKLVGREGGEWGDGRELVQLVELGQGIVVGSLLEQGLLVEEDLGLLLEDNLGLHKGLGRVQRRSRVLVAVQEVVCKRTIASTSAGGGKGSAGLNASLSGPQVGDSVGRIATQLVHLSELAKETTLTTGWSSGCLLYLLGPDALNKQGTSQQQESEIKPHDFV